MTRTVPKHYQTDRVGTCLQARPSGADDILVTSRIASAAGVVIRRLDSWPAVAEALQALLSGDLKQPASAGQASLGLIPFYPPGKRDFTLQYVQAAQLFAIHSSWRCPPRRLFHMLLDQRRQRLRISRVHGWLK